MRICVVGAGYVGLVSAAVLAEWGHDVTCVDNDEEKIAQLQSGVLPVYEDGLLEMAARNRSEGRLHFRVDLAQALTQRELVMIAVGTPAGKNGNPDLSAVWNVVKSLKECSTGQITLVIKSTVPVGTCEAVAEFLYHDEERFDVVSAPEFLRQGTAIRDYLAPDRMVFGCQTSRAKQVMQDLFRSLECPVIFTDWHSSEMIKYAANAFLALKISYINLIANLSEKVGGNVQDVAQGVGLDRRIGPAFLKPGVGFGGSCLPKDTRALVALGEENGVNVWLLRDVLQINFEQRVHIVKKLEEVLGGLEGKKIAVLGLSFKPNTGDVREAPALTIISRILERGGKAAAYDPVVDMEALSREIPFIPALDPYDAVSGAHAVVFLTEWGEFAKLDLRRIRGLLKFPLLIDGRHIFDPQALKALGFVSQSYDSRPVLEFMSAK